MCIETGPPAGLVGAPDQVALIETAGLLAERRLLERLEVLVELRAVEAPDRLLVGPADGDGEVWRDVDRRSVAPGLRRVAVNLLDAARDLLGREHGGHPALAVLARAPSYLGVVAAGVDRQRVLRGLREALDLLEVHGFPAEGGLALGEEEAQRPHALVDERAAVGGLRVRKERLVLLAVGAGADAQDYASA